MYGTARDGAASDRGTRQRRQWLGRDPRRVDPPVERGVRRGGSGGRVFAPGARARAGSPGRRSRPRSGRSSRARGTGRTHGTSRAMASPAASVGPTSPADQARRQPAAAVGVGEHERGARPHLVADGVTVEVSGVEERLARRRGRRSPRARRSRPRRRRGPRSVPSRSGGRRRHRGHPGVGVAAQVRQRHARAPLAPERRIAPGRAVGGGRSLEPGLVLQGLGDGRRRGLARSAPEGRRRRPAPARRPCARAAGRADRAPADPAGRGRRPPPGAARRADRRSGPPSAGAPGGGSAPARSEGRTVWPHR